MEWRVWGHDKAGKKLFLKPDLDEMEGEDHPSLESAFERIRKGGMGHRYDEDTYSFKKTKIHHFTMAKLSSDGGWFPPETHPAGWDWRNR